MVAEVLDQVVAAAVRGQVVEDSHVLWLVLSRVRADEALVEFRLGCR